MLMLNKLTYILTGYHSGGSAFNCLNTDFFLLEVIQKNWGKLLWHSMIQIGLWASSHRRNWALIFSFTSQTYMLELKQIYLLCQWREKEEYMNTNAEFPWKKKSYGDWTWQMGYKLHYLAFWIPEPYRRKLEESCHQSRIVKISMKFLWLCLW